MFKSTEFIFCICSLTTKSLFFARIDTSLGSFANSIVGVEKEKGEVVFDRIAYVTKDELDSTEKYLKGHLTLEKLNKAIDEIHQILEAKYKLLSMSAMKLNGEMLKKYRAFKDQETKETYKQYFFTDNELKGTFTLKLDNTGRAILAVLRHLNRIKDVGGSLKRYVIVD